MAAQDCAGGGEGGHAVHEPDCKGGAESDFGGEVGQGAKGGPGEDAGPGGTVEAEFLLEEGIVWVAL